MAVTLPNNPLGTTVVSTELDDNFTTLANKFGSIVDADIASGASITVTKLAAYYQEVLVTLNYYQDIHGGAAAWPTAGATTPLVIVPIPYASGSAEDWRATEVAWICSATGDGNGAFDVRYGEYDSGGSWSNTSSVVTSVSMPNSSGADDANDGRQTGLSVDLAAASTSRSLALMSAAQGSSVMGSAGEFLSVTVRMRRKLQ